MKGKWRVALVGSALFLGSLPAAYWLLDQGYLRFNYPALERFPLQGIDVSHHQGDIDWPRLKGQGVAFAFIKATEGGDHVDRKFKLNWAAAGAAGIPRGAYHFFTFCKTGLEQARNFLGVVPRESGALPVVVDLEFGGNCKREPTEAELGAEVGAFVAEVTKVFPSRPIFYVTPEFNDRYLKKHSSLFPVHRLWLRNVFFEPRQESCARWVLWQFAARGRLDGIKGAVDLNVFCGSRPQFSEFFGLTL